MAVVDSAGAKLELLPHELEERGQGGDRRGYEVTFDARDRRLRRARTPRELRLRQAVATTRFLEQLTCRHLAQNITSDIGTALAAPELRA